MPHTKKESEHRSERLQAFIDLLHEGTLAQVERELRELSSTGRYRSYVSHELRRGAPVGEGYRKGRRRGPNATLARRCRCGPFCK